MKIVSLFFIAVLLAGSSVTAGAQGGKIVVIESADAPGHLTRERLEQCSRLLKEDAGVADRPLPPIFVMHISRKQGMEAGFKNLSVALHKNTTANGTDFYYELWIIGDPSTTQYSIALNQVIEVEFQLHRTTEEQVRTVMRTVHWLDATVSANGK